MFGVAPAEASARFSPFDVYHDEINLERWLHHYNYHRPHMAHAGRPPISVVNNVPRKHS